MTAAGEYRALGEAAWAWVMDQVRDEDGPWLPEEVTGDETAGPGADRDSLYAGVAGLALTVSEIRLCRDLSGAEEKLVAGISSRLLAGAGTRTEPSLYLGLAGDVAGLRLLDPGAEQIALRRLTNMATPAGWATTLDVEPGSTAPITDLIQGSAGVLLAAVWAGGDHARQVATIGAEALLNAAERDEVGLDWAMVPGRRSRGPNYSHGTAGVAAALAVAGQVLGRRALVAAAEQGARHLLAVGSLDDGGFVVPHTIPPSTRDVEPITYSWCHGPTGTSHLFAALSLAGVSDLDGIGTGELRRRCLHSVLISGVPRRLRPGFWDNDGRCCGTAGVGDVLLDAAQDEGCRPGGDPSRAAELLLAARGMGDALAGRAIQEGAGTYWRFLEHRRDPPLLPPGTSWMQGAAGIAAFLLRLARVCADGLEAPVVDRPDQWWAVPDDLRTVHRASPSPPGQAG